MVKNYNLIYYTGMLYLCCVCALPSLLNTVENGGRLKHGNSKHGYILTTTGGSTYTWQNMVCTVHSQCVPKEKFPVLFHYSNYNFPRQKYFVEYGFSTTSKSLFNINYFYNF